MSKKTSTYDLMFNNIEPPKSNLDLFAKNIGNNGGGTISYDPIDYGQDITQSEYIDSGFDWYHGSHLDEHRAQNQPVYDKLSKGVARVGLKAISEIGKMPGVLGGVAMATASQVNESITGEDSTDFVKTAFDNPWINAVGNWEEKVKEEGFFGDKSDGLPVYVKRAVQSGSLMDNITSSGFWATEGADGIGYILSMMAPGAAISKLGLGAKMLGTSKWAKMAASLDKADDAIKGLSKISKILPTSAKNADLLTATAFNTLFEAGAEAKGAMDSYTNEIKPGLDAALEAGQITQEQYDAELAKASNVGRNVFAANALILLGPNLMMNKMLWGKPTNKLLAPLSKLEEVATPSLKTKIARGLGDFAKVGASEGLFEEGMQSVAETYYTKRPDAKSWDLLGDLTKSYIEMTATTEGQKAMFLGAVLGGGMGVMSGTKERKESRDAANKLIHYAKDAMSSAFDVLENDIYVKKEGTDEIVFEEELVNGEYVKKPKIDMQKVVEKAASLDKFEKLSLDYDVAVATGQKDVADAIRNGMFTRMAIPFIQKDELGVDVLEAALKESAQLAKIAKEEEKSTDSLIKEIVAKATELKNDFSRFQEFAPEVYDFSSVQSTKNDKTDFINKLNQEYVTDKAVQYDAQKSFDKYNEELNKLVKENGMDPSVIDGNPNLIRDLGNRDSRVKITAQKREEAKNNLEYINKDVNKYWDNKTIVGKFKERIEDLEKARAEGEEIKRKTEETVALVNAAKNLDELDSVEMPEGIPTEGILKAKADKRAELEKERDEEIESAKKEGKESSDKNRQQEAGKDEIFEYLSENFKVGETVTLPDSEFLPKERRGKEVKILEIDKDQITFEDKEGKVSAFSNSTLNKAAKDKSNSEGNFVTEGSVKGDNTAVVEKDESGKPVEERNQPRIIITDNSVGNKAFPNISDAAVEFERNPVNKIGQTKNIEINQGQESISSTQSEIEAKKADIEKRRQEELNNKQKFVSSKKRQEKEGGEYKEISLDDIDLEKSNLEDLQGVKKIVLLEQRGVNSDGIPVGTVLINMDEGLTTFEVFFNTDKINAKYDAELAALEGKTKSTIKSIFSPNQQKALDMYNANDFSDIEFLADNLPLNIKLTDSVSAPLETVSGMDLLKLYNKVLKNYKEYDSGDFKKLVELAEKTKKGETSSSKEDLQLLANYTALFNELLKHTHYNDIFNKTSKELRRTIIKELQEGTKIEDITVPIVGQWNGTLQLDGQNENILTGLYEIAGDIKNLKTENFYFVNDFKDLTNPNGEFFNAARSLAKGEVYLKIKTAAGVDFPLKLNVRKYSDEQAEALYELYKQRFDKNDNTPLVELDEASYKLIKDNLKEELALFDKPEKDITIKDVIELLIWEGSKNSKTQVKITEDRSKVIVLSQAYTKEDFEKEDSKAKFIYTLKNDKRQQIRFKPKKNDNNNLNIRNSRKYLEYLIKNKILNTNAKMEVPTFQGRTTMYLDKWSVKVKGKESKYNKDVVKTYSSRVIGSNTKLKQKLPGLFNKTFILNADGTKYIDEKGVEHNRATSLKDKPFDSTSQNLVNSSVRGDVVDDLTRLFFKKENIDKTLFLKHAVATLDKQNKLKNSQVEISENYFSSLYDILETYHSHFDKLGYTIYSEVPTIGGSLKQKGNIAGTVDLLAYDNNNQSWVLIDLKTSASDRGLEYDKEENPSYVTKKGYSYKYQDLVQLNAYRELFYQMTGKHIAELKIMPLTSPADKIKDTTNTFTSISRSSKAMLLEVDSTKSIYDRLDIKEVEEDLEVNDEGVDIGADNVSTIMEDFGNLFGSTAEQKTKVTREKKEEKPASELTDAQANEYLTRLMVNFPMYRKDFQSITEDKVTKQDKLAAIKEFLINQGVSVKEIKTKCS